MSALMPRAGSTQRRVLEAFRAEPLSIEDIQLRFQLRQSNANAVLVRLAKRGLLERVRAGLYRKVVSRG